MLRSNEPESLENRQYLNTMPFFEHVISGERHSDFQFDIIHSPDVVNSLLLKRTIFSTHGDLLCDSLLL